MWIWILYGALVVVLANVGFVAFVLIAQAIAAHRMYGNRKRDEDWYDSQTH